MLNSNFTKFTSRVFFIFTNVRNNPSTWTDCCFSTECSMCYTVLGCVCFSHRFVSLWYVIESLKYITYTQYTIQMTANFQWLPWCLCISSNRTRTRARTNTGWFVFVYATVHTVHCTPCRARCVYPLGRSYMFHTHYARPKNTRCVELLLHNTLQDAFKARISAWICRRASIKTNTSIQKRTQKKPSEVNA